MAAKHRHDTAESDVTSRPRRISALVLTAVLLAAGVLLGATAPSAAAADRTATITLSGITSNTYPTGGNTVWVQPGTSLTISQSPINIGANQGLLGTVSGLVKGILGGLLTPKIVGLKATLNLSSVGKGTVTLGSGQAVATPALAKGVYPITWSFTAITALGQNVALNGNQLNPLGIRLNAQNQYIGYIVSDTRSPCGGAQCISLQTPTLSVAPSVPVAGQLPTITVPGQNVNVPVPSVPGVNAPLPSLGGSGSSTPTGGSTGGAGTPKPGSSGSASPTNPYGYDAPDCTGPCAVMPRGGGGGGTVGGAYGVTLGDLGDPAAVSGGSDSGSSGSGADAQAAIAAGGNGLGNGDAPLAADNAFDGSSAGSTTPPLPTTLAILAGAALVGATGLWVARRRSARA